MGMTIFDSKDPACRAGLELGLVTAGIAGSLADAHAAGVQAAEERREHRAAYIYATELAEARGRADELGCVAMRAVRHVASLEAEVRRLRVALEQRQAHINRLSWSCSMSISDLSDEGLARQFGDVLFEIPNLWEALRRFELENRPPKVGFRLSVKGAGKFGIRIGDPRSQK